MRVLKTLVGPKVKWVSGGVYDIPTTQAKWLIDNGKAEKVKSTKSKSADIQEDSK